MANVLTVSSEACSKSFKCVLNLIVFRCFLFHGIHHSDFVYFRRISSLFGWSEDTFRSHHRNITPARVTYRKCDRSEQHFIDCTREIRPDALSKIEVATRQTFLFHPFPSLLSISVRGSLLLRFRLHNPPDCRQFWSPHRGSAGPVVVY